MKSVLVRLAAVMMIAAGALVAWADGGPTPGGGGQIAGMKCQSTAQQCNLTSQEQNCVGKTSGADCTFCAGTNSMKSCITAQGYACINGVIK
ncbi:MAG: hypothetical protein BroJett003_18780 [Planctomycetota bacterium]|nr:MAG: hypothetical protein BroJett003_18780 [Planctomycetota bacterium]